MQSKKEMEDFFYNHNDEKTEKMYQEKPRQKSSWSQIYQKLKQTSLQNFIKK